jgi:hypothetical protein
MRAMVLNAGMTASTAIFFTIVITSLSHAGTGLVAGSTQAGPHPRSRSRRRAATGRRDFAAMLGHDRPAPHPRVVTGSASACSRRARRRSALFRRTAGATVRHRYSRRSAGLRRHVRRGRRGVGPSWTRATTAGSGQARDRGGRGSRRAGRADQVVAKG